MRMEQPGSSPLDIPEQVPNPVRVPNTEPVPQVPQPTPVRKPERVE